MTPERKEKIQALRDKLKNLSPEQKQALINRGIITTIEGHPLSVHNTILLYLQSNGITPSVVGGFNQWKSAGKIVKRGEHGFMIWFPIGEKNDNGDIIRADNFYTATVFDISQVEDIGTKHDTPEIKPDFTPVITPIIKPIEQPSVKPINEPDMAGFKLV